MTIGLVDSDRRPVARLDLTLGKDMVTIDLDHANLAMIDRDQLHVWGADPRTSLHRHDVVLTGVDGWIALGVGEVPPAWITPSDVRRLLAVL